jgi:ribonuclease inhibitor
MNNVIFDFSTIESMEDFYSQFADTFELPEYFGNNLDALWDVIVSGEIPLPVTIEFIELPVADEFDDLINLFEQAEEEMDGDLTFIYGQNYDDDEQDDEQDDDWEE